MLFRRLRHWNRIYRTYRKKPRRYANLLRLVDAQHSQSILEIGVYTAQRAEEMINAAALHRPVESVRYFGFDLFEDLTPEILEKELSKMPSAYAQAEARLARTGAIIELHKGFSDKTLPAFVERRRNAGAIDFIFIDGGHHIDTITSDWNNVSQLMGPDSWCVFDDYYAPDTGVGEEFGCRGLIEGLDRNRYEVDLLEPEDRFPKDYGELRVRMALVKMQSRS